MSVKVEKIFLDPRRKLVETVTDWLCREETSGGCLRMTDEGARSLAHVTVVVPTAQSGRQLRLRLAREAEAKGWGGILPPRVVLPMHLIEPTDGTQATATPIQLQAAFLSFLGERPRRETVAGKTVLKEWTHLFRPDSITDVKSHLSFLDQLNDIWRILAGGGLLMREVSANERAAEALAGAMGDEAARWEELAAFESAFFDFLHAHGLRHEVEAIHLAKLSAKALDDDAETLVLPGLADPVSVIYDVIAQQRETLAVKVLIPSDGSDADRFDAWGRPLVSAWTGSRSPRLDGIRNADVIRAATDTELARRIAADFPCVESKAALPSLGLCDEELFAELSAAFLSVGYELHNPERHSLAASSLGRILANLVTLFKERKTGLPWDAFVALLRERDVLAAVLGACADDADGRKPSRAAVLEGVNVCRNAFLPRTVPANGTFDETGLHEREQRPCRAFNAAASVLVGMLTGAWGGSAVTVGGFVRRMLDRLYASRSVPDDEGGREFSAAAAAVRGILSAFADAAQRGLKLSEGAGVGIFRKALADSAYSLEPDSHRALRTEGWLELAWSDADRVALAGFYEGCVPDAVMGHAFLPDALRAAIGLTSNEQRLARDAFLLDGLLRARKPGDVRAYVAQTNNAGDIRRPSRLLFLVGKDALGERTKCLFGELPSGGVLAGREIAEGWLPALPDGVRPYNQRTEYPNGRFSASAIDTWLKCPFTYLFQYGLGMRRVKEKVELEANDFGTLIHRAMERYADEQLARTEKGLAQLHETEDVASALRRIMSDLRRTYGARQSVNLRLQLDAAEARLIAFAPIQAMWAADGWRIAERPEYEFCVRPFAGEDGCDVHVKGSVDRIDYKEGVGYRLIDYKTWDSRQGAWKRILKGGEAEASHAARLKLPLVSDGKSPSRFLSVQLPLYGRCLEAADPAKFAGKIADCCYLILGKTAEDTCVLGSADDQRGYEAWKKKPKPVIVALRETALETARTALRRILANIFWPPGPGEDWRYDVKDLLVASPEWDFRRGTAWRDRQEVKLEELQKEDGR